MASFGLLGTSLLGTVDWLTYGNVLSAAHFNNLEKYAKIIENCLKYKLLLNKHLLLWETVKLNWIETEFDICTDITLPITFEMMNYLQHSTTGKRFIEQLISKVNAVEDFYITSYTLEQYVNSRHQRGRDLHKQYPDGVWTLVFIFTKISSIT